MLRTSPAQASGEFASTTFLTFLASKVIIDKIVCCIDLVPQSIRSRWRFTEQNTPLEFGLQVTARVEFKNLLSLLILHGIYIYIPNILRPLHRSGHPSFPALPEALGLQIRTGGGLKETELCGVHCWLCSWRQWQ